jgi:hypothetical protein
VRFIAEGKNATRVARMSPVWHKADVARRLSICPLSGAKRTYIIVWFRPHRSCCRAHLLEMTLGESNAPNNVRCVRCDVPEDAIGVNVSFQFEKASPFRPRIARTMPH